MDLDFQKIKQQIVGLTDAQLVSRNRDPAVTATQRMLIEAELNRRGVDQHQMPVQTETDAETARPRKRNSIIPMLIAIVIIASVIIGILDDMGFDLIDWLKDRLGI